MNERTPDHDVSGLSLDDQLALLSGADFWRTHAVPAEGIPSLMLSDGPHGIRAQYDGGDNLGLASSVPSTCFPPAVTLAASWNPALVREVGEAVGREARALSVDVVLGPGLNLKRHPFGGRSFEYFSEDPLLSGDLAAAAVQGMQSQGVGACLKHFAVNNQEHRRFVIDAIVDERTLRELYLRGFERAVRTSSPATVMAAYNLVNGEHATDSRRLLTEILRDDWGFDGLVMSDWGAEADRVAGVAAGMDLEMPGGAQRERALRAALRDGTLAHEQVATSAGRVAALARTLSRARSAAGKAPTMDALLEPHDALARRAAAASAVVLRNEPVSSEPDSAHVLPLALTPTSSVALIGAFAEQPRYQGSGSSLVTPTRLTTALEALTEAAAKVGATLRYAPGYEPVRSDRDEALLAEAVETARDAELAIVMVGLPPIAESEGFDRDTLALPAQHDELVRAVAAVARRTVVVLSTGAAVSLPWRDEVDAIVLAHLGGQASGDAVADALLGHVEPSGRLTETWFEHERDIAADDWFPGGTRHVQYREGLLVGYRWSSTAEVPVQYPFGFGLGYGASEWSAPAISSEAPLAPGENVTVSVEIANTGSMERSELVQVYAHDLSGTVPRPRRELVGYARATLAPGEHRRIDVTVQADDLRYWSIDVGRWMLPRGRVELELARDAERVRFVLPLDLAGDDRAPTVVVPAGVATVAVSDDEFSASLERSIPQPQPDVPFTHESTLGDLRASLVGRAFWSVVSRQVGSDARNDEVTRIMYERSMLELPIRGLAQMSGGRVGWRTVDLIVKLANLTRFRAVG